MLRIPVLRLPVLRLPVLRLPVLKLPVLRIPVLKLRSCNSSVADHFAVRASVVDRRSAVARRRSQCGDLHVLSDFDAAGDGEVLHGAASSRAWLRGALGLAPGEAAERVRLARSSAQSWLSPFSACVKDESGTTM